MMLRIEFKEIRPFPVVNLDLFDDSTIMSFFSRGSRRSVRGRGNRGNYQWNNNNFNHPRRMRVSVHFDTNSDEFAYFVRTGQLALGPPHPTPANSFRPPSFHNLQPHPSVLEFPHQPASVQNGWDPQPQPLPPVVNGWGEPERKNQLIVPPLSVVSGNVLPAPNDNTEASSSASPVHSSVPLQLNIADHLVLVEQPPADLPADLPVDLLPIDPPADIPVTAADTVEIPPDGEISLTPVIPELKPVARPTSLSRLSLFPKLFQQMHDYGLF